VTVIEGEAYLAVTVVLAFSVTVQVTVVVVAHPVHEAKALLPDVAGAVSVTDVPAL
jgi:heme exporter protein D